MKKIMLLFACFISVGMFAQESKSEEESFPSYSAKTVTFDEKQNIMELKGDVSFKTAYLELENAEKIVWNKDSKKIMVIGVKKFTIDGSVIVSDNAEKNILRYQIGERTAYLE